MCINAQCTSWNVSAEYYGSTVAGENEDEKENERKRVKDRRDLLISVGKSTEYLMKTLQPNGNYLCNCVYVVCYYVLYILV